MSRTGPIVTRWTRRDFSADPVTLAQRLIGARLVRTLESGCRLSGIIVETEAYLGVLDKAAHSFGGRRTPRTEPMYGPPGTAYVYFTYGMHHCMNVVCGAEGEPVAVLLRALEPVEGIDAIHANRSRQSKRRAPLKATDLCSGPAKICQGLEIDRSLSGCDLVMSDRLLVEHEPNKRAGELVNTPRIGVGYAQEWTAKPLRWRLSGNRHVSRN